MNYPIKDVAITNVYINAENKDGKPFVTKDGKPFRKINFMVDQNLIDEPTFTGKLSTLVFQENDGTFNLASWEAGNNITGEIVKNGDWWNFNLPKFDAKSAQAEIEALKKALEAKEETKEDLSDEDLPF